MGEQPQGNIHEIASKTILTTDEMSAIKGLSYDTLPATFTMSSAVLESCKAIWKTFSETTFPQKALDARQRAKNYFSELAQRGHPDAIQHMSYLSEEPKVEIEFGQQYYRKDNDIVIGKIHKGKTRRILLRDKRDGLPDSDSIVNIHNHPNNLTFSAGDATGMMADEPSVPERCLYYVVNPENIHLIFPTIQTPRVELEQLRREMKDFIGDQYERVSLPDAERVPAEITLMKGIAEKYKLGYYVSSKTETLQRA